MRCEKFRPFLRIETDRGMRSTPPFREWVARRSFGYSWWRYGAPPRCVGLTSCSDEDVMSDTVPCPECHQPARVLDGFTVQRANGPVRYLRLQCERPPSFLV